MKEVRRIVQVGFTVGFDVSLDVIFVLRPGKRLTFDPFLAFVWEKYKPLTVTPDQSKEVERLQGLELAMARKDLRQAMLPQNVEVADLLCFE